MLKCVLVGNESCHRVQQRESLACEFVLLSKVSEGKSKPHSAVPKKSVKEIYLDGENCQRWFLQS